MSINEAINIQTTSINAIAPTTGSLSIGDSQTTGVLNLGTNAGRTGGINIGSSTGTGTITVATTNILNLGVVSAPLSTQKSININGTDDSGGRQYITNLSNFKFRNGTGFNEVNIFDQNSANYFAIGDRQVSGQLRIGSGAGVPRSGAVTIATGASNTCDVNISNTAGTALLPTSGAINIASGTSGIAGSYTVSTNIGSGSTTGAVTIGNTSNATTLASGTTNIATSVGSTSVINILNGGGATTGGSVNIANGASQTTTVNIASGTGTGTVTIGNTGNTTNLNSGITNIGGTLGVTGTISANGGITIGSSKSITCATLPNANANTATLLNNPFRSQTSASNPSLNLTKCGEVAFLSLSANSANLTGGTTASPGGFLQILQATLTNAGVYTVSYLTTLNSSGGGNLIVASAYCDTATATPYNSYYGNQSANYPGAGIAVSSFAIAQTGTFTSFFNAGTVLRSNISINYVSGTTVPTNQRTFVSGTSLTNYFIITRIA